MSEVHNAIETRLQEKGLTLPQAAAPAAAYAPYVVHNGVVYISGQLPLVDGKVVFTGVLSDDSAIERGQQAAQCCALHLLSQVKAACGGDWSRLERCLKLTGFVASAPDFTAQPAVINGASLLVKEILGEDLGTHSRSAVGVSALPFGASVEVEGVFVVR